MVGWNRFSPRSGWVGWRELPEALPLREAPVALAKEDHLLLLGLGADHQVHLGALHGDQWGGWQPILGRVEQAHGLSAARWSEGVALFLLDGAGGALWSPSLESGWAPLQLRPGLGGLAPIAWGGQLHLFWSGQDRRLHQSSLSLGGLCARPQLVPGAAPSTLPPAVASGRSALLLSSVGEAGEIRLARQQALSGWTGWERVVAPFRCRGVSLAPSEGRTYLCGLSDEGSLHVTSIH